MVRAGDFERVVHRFFEAAAIPQAWSGALQALAEACGAEGVAAHSADGCRTIASVLSPGVIGLQDEFVSRWRAPELNSHRSRGLALLKRGWRGAITENDIFTPEEKARDPFHQEFIVPAGFPSFAGVIIAKAPGLMLSASIFRNAAQGAYERQEVEQINGLVEHLRAAGELAMRIGMSSTLRMTDAFMATDGAAALIGRDGRIVHATAAFEALLNGSIHVKAGRLCCGYADADRAIAALVDRAIQYDGVVRAPSAPVILPRRNGQRPLMADVVPVVGSARDLFHRVAAIMMVTDLDAAAAAPQEPILQQAFGLTATEARLAAQIASGRTLPEIARADGVAHETLRTRLKAIFQKTGTTRQTELALLLSRFKPSGA